MKLGYRPSEVPAVVGGPEVFKRMVAAKWLRPVIQQKRLTLYAGTDIAAAFGRLLKGEKLPDSKAARKRKGSCNVATAERAS